MKPLVEYIVKALVDQPDAVKINETEGESITILEINVAPDDVGKVIGKEGRIANSIRTIAKASGAKTRKRVSVEIMTEDRKSRREQGEVPMPGNEFSQEGVESSQ